MYTKYVCIKMATKSGKNKRENSAIFSSVTAYFTQ